MKENYNNILNIINDKSLFLKNEESVNKSLQIAKTFNDYSYNNKIDFFLYWVGNNINEKHEIVIKSFLITQDLSICKLNIYSDIDLNNTILKNLINKFDCIKVNIFNIDEEVKNTPIENCEWNNLIKNHLLNPALESDFFRLLMLYKYGGIWSDFDIIYLRDLRPLMNYEWVYQWGSEMYRMNGAIMRFKKESNISKESLEILKQTKPIIRSLCWADELYQKLREKYNELIVFPGAFFNPEWQIPLSSTDFFKLSQNSTKMFENSFTWHFHSEYNKFNKSIELGSKMDILKNKINYKFNKLFN